MSKTTCIGSGLEELKNPNVAKLAPYLWREENEKILLAEDGLYKYIDDALYKFKIIPSSTTDTQPFTIQDIQFFPMGFNFQKKEQITQIPPNHHFIALCKKRYKLNEKATTIFTVEYSGEVIKDYYFESKEASDNHSLREDMISFLSLLK